MRQRDYTDCQCANCGLCDGQPQARPARDKVNLTVKPVTAAERAAVRLK